MDAPNSTPDQEKEGEQQPNALLIVCEKDNSQEASDHVPPLVSKAGSASNALADRRSSLPRNRKQKQDIPW